MISRIFFRTQDLFRNGTIQNTQIYTNKYIYEIRNALIFSKIYFVFICAFCVILRSKFYAAITNLCPLPCKFIILIFVSFANKLRNLQT